jgi:hypothetical protein
MKAMNLKADTTVACYQGNSGASINVERSSTGR